MLDSIQSFFKGSFYYQLPSFEVAVFSLLLGFVLSTAVAFTYKLTFRGAIFPNHFFQAMILSSLVTGMIMMAVGSNFAVGFGIIGAVSVIRFRTMISDPRNIIFMFVSISIGIATGVKGYAVAVAGTVLFCTISALLYWSRFGSIHFRYKVMVNANQESTAAHDFIFDFCKSVSHMSSRQTDSGVRLEYLVEVNTEEERMELFNRLTKIEGVKNVRMETISRGEEQL